MSTQTPPPRSYVVGLPVTIQVAAGRVVASVDLAEAALSLWEDSGVEERTEAQVRADVAVVDAAYAAGRLAVEAMFVPADPEVIVTLDEDGDPLLICPHVGCLGDEFYEVDQSVRWNELELDGVQPDEGYTYGPGAGWGVTGTGPNPLAGLPCVTVHQRDGDYETVSFKCQSCLGDVDLPEWIERSWT